MSKVTNADIKMSECCTCGAKWQTGQDGRHSCSSKLSNDNQVLVEQNKALKLALLDARGFAELIQIMGTTDCEIYKHELRGDSELAITRIDKALENK